MEQQSKINFLINLAFTVIVGTIIYICGRFLIGYLLPFVIATVIAWIVQKPARKLAVKLKAKTGVCAAILSAVIFFVAVVLIFFIAYRLWLGSKEFFRDMPKIVSLVSALATDLRTKINTFFYQLSPEMSGALSGIGKNMFENLGEALTNTFSLLATSIAKRTPTFLFSCVVALVASCYIAKDYEMLVRFLKELCGEKRFSKILEVKEIFTLSIWKIIKGYIILMLITFMELLAGFFILKIKHAFLLAFLVSFVDLLPVFGTGTVLVPWGLAELFFDNPRGFGIIVLYLVITLVRNFLEPKIIGGQIGINPLFTLLVMFAGLRIMGFWGLIIFPLVFIVVIKYYKHQLKLEKSSN